MRVWVAASIGLVVVSSLIAAFVLLQDADPDGPAPPAPRVLKAKHAADAVEGDDYDVLGELHAADASAAQAVLPDGRVVATLTQNGAFGSEEYLLAVVDPASGEREQLPAPWLGLGEVYPSATLLDDDRLMVTWSFRERGQPRSKVMIVDLASGTHEQSDVPVPPLPDGVKVLSSPQPASDGRLWFQTGDEHEHVVDGRCVIGGLVASNELAVAICKLAYGRQVAVDAEGRLVADFRLGYEYPAVGDRWILISPFAYDTQTGRLLRFFGTEGADFTRPLDGDLTVLPVGLTEEGPDVDRWTVLRLRSAR